ncbi:hypothetical protein J2S89_003531 [Arthrobacter bambusae]|nr:hypothetical protein [Arthrobacter bambusae]MDQ0098784.1 hypothetical protein [Arthrobacter bambusae]
MKGGTSQTPPFIAMTPPIPHCGTNANPLQEPVIKTARIGNRDATFHPKDVSQSHGGTWRRQIATLVVFYRNTLGPTFHRVARSSLNYYLPQGAPRRSPSSVARGRSLPARGLVSAAGPMWRWHRPLNPLDGKGAQAASIGGPVLTFKVLGWVSLAWLLAGWQDCGSQDTVDLAGGFAQVRGN